MFHNAIIKRVQKRAKGNYLFLWNSTVGHSKAQFTHIILCQSAETFVKEVFRTILMRNVEFLY